MTLAPWIPFFSTVAEATATLAGLVIVAVSVNVRSIIESEHLPLRAFAAIGSLIQVMVTSAAALIPQPVESYAVELGIAAVIGWTFHVRNGRLMYRSHARIGRPLSERIGMLVIAQAQLLPLAIGAVMVGLGDLNGVYFVAFAAVAAVIASAINAWVLLVEILR